MKWLERYRAKKVQEALTKDQKTVSAILSSGEFHIPYYGENREPADIILTEYHPEKAFFEPVWKNLTVAGKAAVLCWLNTKLAKEDHRDSYRLLLQKNNSDVLYTVTPNGVIMSWDLLKESRSYDAFRGFLKLPYYYSQAIKYQAHPGTVNYTDFKNYEELSSYFCLHLKLEQFPKVFEDDFSQITSKPIRAKVAGYLAQPEMQEDSECILKMLDMLNYFAPMVPGVELSWEIAKSEYLLRILNRETLIKEVATPVLDTPEKLYLKTIYSQILSAEQKKTCSLSKFLEIYDPTKSEETKPVL